MSRGALSPGARGLAVVPALIGSLIAGLASGTAAAAEDPVGGFEVGAQVGIAHPGGAVGGGSSATTPNVGDLAPTTIPIGLDGGYRFSPATYLGATLEWGPALGQGDALCVACAFRFDFQARAELRFHLLPRRTFDPWISVGAGWEELYVGLSGTTSASATYGGPVLGALAVGLDVRSRAIAVGPFFGASLAEFVSRSLDPAPTGEPSIEAHALHGWFTLGLRGTFDLFRR